LSTWTFRHVLLAWVLWPCILAVIIGIGVVLSGRVNNGYVEVPVAFTRSAIWQLLAVAVVPPGCLTLEWFLMRERRATR
jgi:hypothetical protein